MKKSNIFIVPVKYEPYEGYSRRMVEPNQCRLKLTIFFWDASDHAAYSIYVYIYDS